MNVWTRTGIAAIGLAVGWASVGCATERDPINRVQANALEKSFFVGASLSDHSDDPEFHYRNTVVDVPYGLSGGTYQDSFLFTPAAADTNRIKWEIQETLIVARQTYERFENSDGAGGKATNSGQIVAAFPILKHFDIKRDYNPATGAENNVVGENATDRPWYERSFMRVDWSKNLVTDGYSVDTLSMVGVWGGVKYDPIAYEVRDPDSPDAPHFAPEQGYFDVTTKAFAAPETLTFDWGSIPACYAILPYITWFHPAVNCNPTEVTLRLSFKKVTDTDFEPTEWDGNKAQAFGWITTNRLGFDRNYGLVDQKWHRLAMKYNIWEKSHIEGAQCGVDYWRDAKTGAVAKYKTDGSGKFVTDGKTGVPILDEAGKPWQSTPIGANPKRDNDKNGTDDECEFRDASGGLLHAGAYCDTLSRKCSLPLYERKIKTTPWYHSETSPEDLFPSSADALNQWNIAIKRAAQLGALAEAKRVGADTSGIITDEQELLDDAAGTKVPNVFVLCHNPPIDGQDAEACFEKKGDTKVAPRVRLGDVRYHIVNLIQNPQMPSAWGVVFPSSDPLTGEAIGTTVTEWLYITDLQARYATDLVRWSNGELTDDQILDGSFMKEWVQASQLGTKQFKPALLGTQEIASRVNSVDPKIGAANGLTPEDIATPLPLRRKKAAKNLAALGTSVDRDIESRRRALLGSKFETAAITPDMLTRVGLPKDMPVAGNDLAITRASILRGANPEVARWFERTAAQTMGPKGNCILQAGQFDSILGMARQAARMYPLPDRKAPDFAALLSARNEKMRLWLRERMHVAVIAHEMGHHMGLEHNFTASYDSLNYHTEYWQLRTRNGQEKGCADLTKPNDKGENCAGPRWIDPVTDTEENGQIWKWGMSSIMDYAGDLSQDTLGIGSYDKAAMRFGYGNIVDVDVDSKADSPKGKAYLAALDGFGGPVGQTIGDVHYSQYQDKYNPLGKCTAQSGNDPLTAKCTGFQMDHVSIRDMKSVAKFGNDVLKADASTMAHFAVDPQNRVRHPYMFGTDTFADETNSTVFRFDAGADAYEQLQYLIGNYEHYYPFTHFRNGKSTFSTAAAEGRSLRTFRPLKGIMKAFALEAQLSPADDLKNPSRLLPYALGGSDALAFMARVLTRPEPGPYVFREGKTYADRASLGEELRDAVGDFTIPVGSGDGRFLHDEYDYTQGYNWSSYQKQAGSFVDKFYAFFYLVEAYDNFTFESKDTYVDGRYRNVNFLTLYPNQVRRLLTNMMQDDPQSLGPYIKAPEKKGDAAHVVYLPWEKYDRNDSTTTSLEYPSDATILSPLVGWEQQKLGLLILFQHGASTQNMDLLNQMRVFSPGGLDTVDIPLAEQIRYRDPLTGILYVARAGGKEIVNSKRGPVEKLIGARMIQYANKLASQSYVVLSTDANGESTYQKDSKGAPVCKSSDCTVAEAKLKGFSANLDTARELSRYLGYGPL